MALTFVVIGIGSVLFSLWCLTEKLYIVAILLFIVAVAGFAIPAIGNTDPIEVEHFTVYQNTWEGIIFDEVKQIDYDKCKYSWWTYSRVDQAQIKQNVIITDYVKDGVGD